MIKIKTQNISDVFRISERIKNNIKKYKVDKDIFLIQILDLENKTYYEILYDPSKKVRMEETKMYQTKDECIPYKTIKIKDEEGILEEKIVKGPVFREEIPEAVEKLLKEGQLEWVKEEAKKIKSLLEELEKLKNSLDQFSYLESISKISGKISSLLNISEQKLHHEIWEKVCREHPEYMKIMLGYSFSDEEFEKYVNDKKRRIREILESHGFEEGEISVKVFKTKRFSKKYGSE